MILNLDGWYDELEKMNQGKRGAAYPDSFVRDVRRSILGTRVALSMAY
jgi:hypothetical protein